MKVLAKNNEWWTYANDASGRTVEITAKDINGADIDIQDPVFMVGIYRFGLYNSPEFPLFVKTNVDDALGCYDNLKSEYTDWPNNPRVYFIVAGADQQYVLFGRKNEVVHDTLRPCTVCSLRQKK